MPTSSIHARISTERGRAAPRSSTNTASSRTSAISVAPRIITRMSFSEVKRHDLRPLPVARS